MITQLDPIRVVGRVPYDSHFRRAAILTTPELVMERVEVTLILPTGEKYPHVGRIVGGGHEFDSETQTIATWAEFPNPENLLRPGLNVTLHSRIKPN